MPDTTAECTSDRVAAVTRAANVEALNSWSACRIRAVSKVLVASGVGFLPLIMYRKLPARLSRGFGATGALPRRMRSQAATRVGSWAVRRSDFRSVASRPLSAASGSKAESADTPVRITSIGVVFLGSVLSIAISFGGSLRFAVEARAFRCASSSLRDGSRPCHRRNVTSSNVECATRSSTS
jgi:hypothetical protein